MRKWLIALSALALLPLALVQTGGATGGQGGSGIEVVGSVTPVVSAPLRSLPKIRATMHRRQVEAAPRLGPDRSPTLRGPSGRTRGPIDRGPAVSRMPNTMVEFDGMTYATTAGYYPPDTVADVGPNHIVEMVNSSVQIFDKTGASLAGPSSLASFWNTTGTDCDTADDGDPIVLYDEAADRWLLSQFTVSGPPYYECVAISTTADPTGTWYQYAFQTSTSDFPDYPKLGVWNDSYFMASNLYPSGGGVKVGVYAFERDEMILGNPATLQKETVNGAYGMLPADLDGATAAPGGTPGTFVAYINGSPDRLRIYEFDVDWATPANTTFATAQSITVDPFDNQICANLYECVPQPGTGQKLDSITDLVMFRLGYRNFGSHQDMVVVHTVDVGGKGAIRWYHLRTSGGSWSVEDSGTWSGSLWRWIPTAAMDRDGNIAIGYNVSSGASESPGLRYAGRLANDPAGTLGQGEQTMVVGGGSQTGSERWGDYASMSVDPSDDCTFWFAGEYQPNNASVNWRTRIGSFKFNSCGKKKLSISDRKRAEGDSGTTKFRFTITLSSAHSSPVTVDWETIEQTAHAPSDYTSDSGTVTFAPGQTTKRVAVFVNGDTMDETNETFKVKLSNPTNAAIIDDIGIGTIKNDD